MTAPLRKSGGDILGGGMFASWGLFVLAIFAAFGLAALAISGAWAARLGAVIEPRLAGDVTVVVWGRELESADAATARAVESLSARPGTTASALEPDVSDSWTGALIGGAEPGSDGPRLIAVRAPGGNTSTSGLVERLRSEGIVAAADDHRGTGGPLERRAILSALIVVGGVVVLYGALLVGSLATGGAIVTRKERRLALMIRLGAQRRYLSSLVRRKAAMTASGGALVGSALGLLAAVSVLRAYFPGAPLAARLTPSSGALVLVLASVLVLIAAAGAGLGAGTALSRAERGL